MENTEVNLYSCPHYKRKCKFYASCCNKVYRCKFCHDNNEDHYLDPGLVNQLQCSDCHLIQPIQKNCDGCDISFGKYFCLDCKLLDDDTKLQFHCNGCGICRIGDEKEFFHCEKCNMCLPIHLEGKHICIENVSRRDCPVCLSDIHTSREPSQIPKCHHLIHQSCYLKLLKNNIYNCPVCSTSLIKGLETLWEFYDDCIRSTPMPDLYRDIHVQALCRDCWTKGPARFHVFALKCPRCGSYNTVRDKGPFLRKIGDRLLPVNTTELTAEPQPRAGPSDTESSNGDTPVATRHVPRPPNDTPAPAETSTNGNACCRPPCTRSKSLSASGSDEETPRVQRCDSNPPQP